MYKYQQEINETYQTFASIFFPNNNPALATKEDIQYVNNFVKNSLSAYAHKKFFEDGYYIDHTGLHTPEPNPIESLPTIEMTCAKSNNTKQGCYFVGMVGTNPITEKTYYLVKVGYASDISRRIKQYANTNPMLYHNNCTLCINNANEEKYRNYEHNCHMYLARHAIGRAQNSNEWFYVDKETYLKLCKKFSDTQFFLNVALGRED